jgi:hypothetical protein
MLLEWGFVLNVFYVLPQTILSRQFLSCLSSRLSCEASMLPHLGAIWSLEWSCKHNFYLYLLPRSVFWCVLD